jgi:hypothetical protein
LCSEVVVGVETCFNPSAELLGQRDDDALGAADVAGPIAVLVLLQLANEFGAMGMQMGRRSLSSRGTPTGTDGGNESRLAAPRTP